jgi:streptogramin lyase
VTTHLRRSPGELGAVVPLDARAVPGQPIELSNGAEAIAAGLGAVWVTDLVADAVWKVDPSSRRTTAIDVGRAPNGIAIGSGDLWVTSALDRTVRRVDPATGEGTTISLLDPPTAIAARDDAVWITSAVGDSVVRIDPSTNTVGDGPGLDGPRGIALDPTGSAWVAVGQERRIVRIDEATGEIVGSHAVDGMPDAIAIGGNGDTWVTVRAP